MNANKMRMSLIGLVCVFALLLSVCSFTVAAADGGNTVTATTSALLGQGGSGTCYVYIDSTEGLAALDVTVHFDPTKVKVTSAYNSASCTLYDYATNTDSLQFTYILDGKGTASKTRLFYFNYQVLTNADIGDTHFDITIGEAYDSALNDVVVSGSRCGFTITETVTNKTCIISGSSAVSTSVEGEFSLNYMFSTNQIASGSAVINYDHELFEVVEVAEGNFLNEKFSDINAELTGAIYISFVGIDYGTSSNRNLVTVKFRTLKNISETSQITLKVTDLYDKELNPISCSGYTTTATVNFDESYRGDAPRMSVSTQVDMNAGKVSATIALDADSHLGAGDFELAFDPAVLRLASYTQAFTPDLFHIGEKNLADGILMFSIINLEDIVDEITVLTLEFDILNSCSEQTTELRISGEKLKDSLVQTIPLNFVNGNAYIEEKHTYSSDCDTTCAYCDVTRSSESAHTYDGITDNACNDCDYVRQLTSVSISAIPTKTGYIEGKGALDVTGGKLTLVYADGASGDIDMTASMVSGFDNTVVGVQTLCVTYSNKEMSFAVEIYRDYSNEWEYTINGGEVTIDRYDGNGTTATIPSTIEGLPVTTISYDAFNNCTSLVSITIPDSVTCIDGIGVQFFSGCTSLTGIWVSENNPAYSSDSRGVLFNKDKTVLMAAPYKISGSYTIPSGVTGFSRGAFAGRTGLTNIVIPDGVTGFNYSVFEGCTGLTSVIIPDSVTTIKAGACDGCTNLTTVIYCGTQEQWDAIDVDESNEPLTEATLQLHNIENGVCTICGHKVLYTVTFKNWDGTVLSTKTYHYGDVVTVPTNPTKAADNTYTYTFAGWDSTVVACAGDATYKATYDKQYINYTVVFKNWDDTVISTQTYHYGDVVAAPADPTKAADNTYTYTFAGWDNDVVANCVGNATYKATFTPNYIEYTVVFKNWDDSVISTKTYHYGDVIDVPADPTKDADSTYTYAFAGWDSNVVAKCAGNATYTATYTTICLYNYSIAGSKVTITGYTGSETNLVIPSTIEGLPVTGIGNSAFKNHTSLASVTIPNCITSIDWYAFAGCSGLTEITIPDSVTSIGGWALYNCSDLTSVTLSKNLTTINNALLYSCPKLTSIIIPDGVTSIGSSVFFGCTALTSVTIPDSVTSIGHAAFQNCSSLTYVVFPDGLDGISKNMFANCTGLKSVVLPSSVTSIGENAFYSCNSLRVVFYRGTTEQKSNITIESGNGSLNNPTWHYEVTETVFADQDCYYCAECDSCFLPDGVRAMATVVFNNWDGTVISTQSVHYNGTVTIPTAPTRQHEQPNVYKYVFNGWSADVSTACKGNATYTATYKEDYVDYTVVFKNWDGTVLSTKTYHWGDAVTVPANPTKDADNVSTYTFAGWDNQVVACAGNATYTATYTTNYTEYTVVFKNWDGTVLSTKTYHWGDAVTVPANPTKAADNVGTYTFAGWGKTVATSCNGNVTYTAIYTTTYIDYTVVFMNWNDTVLSTKIYHWGDEIVVPADPTKPTDNIYTYAFAGWDCDVMVNCAGNATYKATYTEKYIEYTVVFTNWNGIVLSTKAYHWGDTVTAPANPTRAADAIGTHVFAGWDKAVATSCDGNVTYTATYTTTYIEYTVVFKNWDGTVLSTKSYHWGETVTVPANPTRPDDSSYIYTFTGWDKTVATSCNGNVVYTAVYSSKSRVPSTITSSTYEISGGTISNISIGTTVSALVGKLNEGQYVKVYNGNQEVSGTTTIGTGMVVKVMDGNTVKASVTVVVTGDTNGDGKTTVTDMLAIKSHLLKKSTLSGAAGQAADTSGDNALTITDFIQMKAHILGKSTITPRSASAVALASTTSETTPATTQPAATVVMLNNITTDAIVPTKKDYVVNL